MGVGLDADDVAAGGSKAGAGVATAPAASVRGRTLDDLELVTVQVKGVDSIVHVVDNDVHSVPVVDNEGVDVTVESSVGVLVAKGGC